MAEPFVKTEIRNRAVENVGEDLSGRRGQVAAEKVRKVLQERGARAVLEDADRKRGITGIDRDNTLARFDKKADQDNAGKRIDDVNRFLREGYDSLDPNEQQDRRDEVLDAMLNSQVMGDVIRNMDPALAEKYASGLLQDKHFQALVNERMQKISERKFTPKASEIKSRAAVLKAADSSLDDKAAQAKAVEELQKEFRSTTQRDLDNVLGSSAHALIRENLDAADEVVLKNADAFDKEVNTQWSEDIAKLLESRWNRRSNPNAYSRDGAIRKDWDAFAGAGIDGLPIGDPPRGAITQEQMDHLDANPELKKQLEEQIGQSLIIKRMRAGVLKDEDMSVLADAKWMGETPTDRVNKIQEIFESHSVLKDLIAQGQAEGIIDKNLWDKIKAAGPYAATGGMLLALLSLLAVPLAAAAPVMTAAGIGGGAAAGAAKFKFDSR